jgi:hypothetical protein
MKKMILFIGFIVSIAQSGYTQSSDSIISIQKRRYLQNDKIMKRNELKSVLLHCQASMPDFKKAKSSSTIGSVFMGTGAVCILAGAGINFAGSVQEANDLDNGEVKDSYPNGLGLILVGAAIELASIPFLVSSGKHLKKSVSNYNLFINKADSRPVRLNLVYTRNGPGLRLIF